MVELSEKIWAKHLKSIFLIKSFSNLNLNLTSILLVKKVDTNRALQK